MAIRELFVHDLTRDIPPVVYFHDLDPQRVRSEVDEYIVTGGHPEGSAARKLVPDGIHEQYVRLLDGLVAERSSSSGGTSPGIWVSGFFGSGKSSFAKLLALSLDGFELAKGDLLADRWLARDQTARGAELRASWTKLHEVLGAPPLSVVFDVGAMAKDGEQVHAVAVRQLQARLGYARVEGVAREELRLERDGLWPEFLALAREVHGRPWAEMVTQARVERHFSMVMHRLDPKAYPAPAEWMERHSGGVGRAQSAEEAAADVAHMVQTRAPGRTLFIVVDEVSQYVLSGDDRTGKLQGFVELLGARLRGHAWFVALGQQKIEEDASKSELHKLKDRFPKRLRVHLDPANIKDVVHQRLLRKKADREGEVRALFRGHRAAIEAHALGGAQLSEDDFVATYPLLPAYVDLLLRITSAIRRSSRAQADDHEIRGLLQLLGEVFRTRRHGDRELGVLVAIDDIYEVQRTALDSELQQSMARVLSHCGDDALCGRVARAVALLQLIQDEDQVGSGGTDASLVAKALFDQVEAGDRTEAVSTALESMRRRNLLGYSERTGYKIQTSAAEEWERERRDIDVSAQQVGELVHGVLKTLVETPEKPSLKGYKFGVGGRFSDDGGFQDSALVDPRDSAAVIFDLRWVRDDSEAVWVRRSAEEALQHRFVWVCGDGTTVRAAAEELGKTLGMLKKLEPSYKAGTLSPSKRNLYAAELGRQEEGRQALKKAVDQAWSQGALYFKGRKIAANELGNQFAPIAQAVGNRLLGELFPDFVATKVTPAELSQLLAPELQGPSNKFMATELGLLELDRGRYVASCSGEVPKRIEKAVLDGRGLAGQVVLDAFGRPPFGWDAGVVKAALAALLRGGRVRVTLEDGQAVTHLRDGGVVDLFEKDRAFKRATFFPIGEDSVGVSVRNRIRKFLEAAFGVSIDAQPDAIADVVASQFPAAADRLHAVQRQIGQLLKRPPDLPGIQGLERALADCVRAARVTQAAVENVVRHEAALRDGLDALKRVEAELSDAGIGAVNRAHRALDLRLDQIEELGPLSPELAGARDRLVAHLASPRPWVDVGAVQPDVVTIETAYQHLRQGILADQQARCDHAQGLVAARSGFSRLTPDEAHEVLAPIGRARSASTADAVAPVLRALREGFDGALARAVDQANLALDQLLSSKDHPVVRVESKVVNREVGTEAELEAFLGELRAVIGPHVAAGRRVRLT